MPRKLMADDALVLFENEMRNHASVTQAAVAAIQRAYEMVSEEPKSDIACATCHGTGNSGTLKDMETGAAYPVTCTVCFGSGKYPPPVFKPQTAAFGDFDKARETTPALEPAPDLPPLPEPAGSWRGEYGYSVEQVGQIERDAYAAGLAQLREIADPAPFKCACSLLWYHAETEHGTKDGTRVIMRNTSHKGIQYSCFYRRVDVVIENVELAPEQYRATMRVIDAAIAIANQSALTLPLQKELLAALFNYNPEWDIPF
jgi:hypothetical protein